VAAGGGSILHFDGARFRVGPDSCGADPGPACYRRGGPLSVTDANVMVGKLIPDFFPKIFGPGQDQPLDAGTVTGGFAALGREVGDGRSAAEVADGFLRIAVENMANAIKKISVQRGYDVTRYALNCFGGAGGQHACMVADALGMTAVLIHPFSSLLSAYGMGLADIRASRQQAIEAPLRPGVEATVVEVGAKLNAQAVDELSRQGISVARVRIEARAHLRYAGTDTALPVLCYRRAAASRMARSSSLLRTCRPNSSARTRRGSASSTRPSRSCSKRWRWRRSMTPRSRRSWSRTPPKQRPKPP